MLILPLRVFSRSRHLPLIPLDKNLDHSQSSPPVRVCRSHLREKLFAVMRVTQALRAAVNVYPPVSGFVGAIGNTPLIKLDRLSQRTGCNIYGKAGHHPSVQS